MNITGNMSQERQTKLESEPKQSVKPMLQKKQGISVASVPVDHY